MAIWQQLYKKQDQLVKPNISQYKAATQNQLRLIPMVPVDPRSFLETGDSKCSHV